MSAIQRASVIEDAAQITGGEKRTAISPEALPAATPRKIQKPFSPRSRRVRGETNKQKMYFVFSAFSASLR
jgi:hypothetical protein